MDYCIAQTSDDLYEEMLFDNNDLLTSATACLFDFGSETLFDNGDNVAGNNIIPHADESAQIPAFTVTPLESAQLTFETSAASNDNENAKTTNPKQKRNQKWVSV